MKEQTTTKENKEKKPQGLVAPGQLLKNGWGIYKKRAGELIGIMIIPSLFLMLSMAVLGLLFAGGVAFSALRAGEVSLESLATSGTVLTTAILVLFFVLLTIITQVWGQVSLLCAVSAKEEKIGIKEAFRRGWKKLRSFYWLSALMSLIIFGGFLLLIIPGIVFAIWFALGGLILVNEGVKGMTALLKSREYMRGNIGGVFVRWLIIFLIMIGIVLTESAFFEFSKTPEWFSAIITNATSLFLFSPLLAIFSFLIYEDLKRVKGAFEFKPEASSKILFGVIALLPILFLVGIVYFTIGVLPEYLLDEKIEGISLPNESQTEFFPEI